MLHAPPPSPRRTARAAPRDGLDLLDGLYLFYFVAATVLVLLFRARLPYLWPRYIEVHALWIIAILYLGAAAQRNRAGRFLHDWSPLLAMIFCFEEVSRFSLLVVPTWCDTAIVAWEARHFAVSPILWLRQWRSVGFTELMQIGYASFYFFYLVVGGRLYALGERGLLRRIFTASAIGSLICYATYVAFPTEGPRWTMSLAPLPGGPVHWFVQQIQAHGGVHGNAFPSLHVADVGVVLYFAWKRLPQLALCLTPLFALLCVGAVYDGYHYASDVFAGLAVAVVALVIEHALARLAR
jgi:membrane-associated phospholipid phosphatase